VVSRLTDANREYIITQEIVNGKLGVARAQINAYGSAVQSAVEKGQRMTETGGVAPVIKEAAKGPVAPTGLAGWVKESVDMGKRALLVAPAWMIVRGSIQAVGAAFKDAWQFAVQWETQMSQIRLVGNYSTASMNVLSQALLDVARNMGVANDEIGKGAAQWAQQGLALSDIPALMTTTARLSLLSGRSITTSVDDLTAIMKSYNIAASNTGHVVDVTNKVMQEHAIGAADLLAGYRRLGPIAGQLGITFEQMSGALAAVQAVTRTTGMVAATQLSNVFQRISTVSLKAIGDLAQVPVYLDKAGNATMEQTSTLRNQFQILSEIALKYKSMNDVDKARLTSQLGGLRANQAIMAFFGNYKEALQGEVDGLMASNSAANASAIIHATLASQATQLTSNWHRFVEGLNESLNIIPNVTGFLKSLSGALDAVNDAGHPGTVKAMKELDEQGKAAEEAALRYENLGKIYATVKDKLRAMTDAKMIGSEDEKTFARMFATAARFNGLPVPENLSSTSDLYKISI
jgi:TP901 family phage tail tape measure protein